MKSDCWTKRPEIDSGISFPDFRATLLAMKPKIFALLFVPLLASSCGSSPFAKPSDEPAEKKPDAPKLVGRIASIPADKRFVLIQSYEAWTVETGAILTTRGPEDRTANLRVTGEKLGQFAAADLQSGTVEVGDAVYSRHVPKPPETTPEEPSSPESPTAPTPELLPELPDTQQESKL
jgi:hypothetical protein